MCGRKRAGRPGKVGDINRQRRIDGNVDRGQLEARKEIDVGELEAQVEVDVEGKASPCEQKVEQPSNVEVDQAD